MAKFPHIVGMSVACTATSVMPGPAIAKVLGVADRLLSKTGLS